MNRYSNPYPPNAAPDPRAVYAGGRTPSPTPSEVDALAGSVINFKRMTSWKYWARKDWIKWYIIGGIILIVTILIAALDKQIVKWLTPAGQTMRSLKFGWLIPIAILFVISFPPLFGHEIVAILVGVVWGLGVGFAIVSAGTFLGEVGNFYAFKYLCRSRGDKLEKTNIGYACLAEVVRRGGFTTALVVRLSIIPGHFSTAVFSTCGMGIITFSVAAILSLPKQLVTVYIGVIIEQSGTGATSTKDRVISIAVFFVTFLITVVAAWYIWVHMSAVKPDVIYNRRKARQAKMMGGLGFSDNTSTALLNPSSSDSDLPLSVLPQRPATQVSFIPPPRSGSGYNMGYGGYTPTFIQGRYGEPLDERKSMDAVEWESQGPQTVDLRGDQWNDSPAANPPIPEDGSRNQSLYPVAEAPESMSGVYSTPLKPAPRVLPNPFDDVHSPDTLLPPGLPQPGQPGPAPGPAPTTRRTFQLSDPPVSQRTPLPSETSQYPPSTSTPSGHTQDPSYYSHGPDASYETYDSYSPLRGHEQSVSDSSFHTAAEDVSRLEPTRTLAPLIPSSRDAHDGV